MHEQRVGLEVGQDMLPGIICSGPAKDADVALLFGTSDVAGDAGVDV